MPVQTSPAAAVDAAAPGLLAFDTSTEQLCAAISSASGEFRVVAAGGAGASATLLPQLQDLLTRAQLRYADLGAIAYGRGPGAFTGLRTSCAVAQGLALGLGLALLPIDSLLIVAEEARAQANLEDKPVFDVAVAMDARMNEAYAAGYRWQRGAWSVLLAPALYSVPALGHALNGQAWHALAGSGLVAFEHTVAWPHDAVRFAAEHDRAGALLRLARAAQAAGHAVDAADALPIYLRDKVAQTTAEREALRARA
jgi:tRNA threonylcarbamoyladenosine biosynthesis protein TsaB